jgi:hypothetical protein
MMSKLKEKLLTESVNESATNNQQNISESKDNKKWDKLSDDEVKILKKIKLGNNGKLLLNKFDKDERKLIDKMRIDGIVEPATFIKHRDAVRIRKSYL